jgi:hypothetical protein
MNRDKKLSKSRFLDKCINRLEQGALEYGDKSFYNSTQSLVNDIDEELMDVANWSSILATSCKNTEALFFLEYLARWSRSMSDRLEAEMQKGSFDNRSFCNEPENGELVDQSRSFLCNCLEKKY